MTSSAAGLLACRGPRRSRRVTFYQGLTTRDTLLAVAERLRRPLPPGWREQFERAEETPLRAELEPMQRSAAASTPTLARHARAEPRHALG